MKELVYQLYGRLSGLLRLTSRDAEGMLPEPCGGG